MYDLLIVGANLYNGDTSVSIAKSIAVQDGKIAQVGEGLPHEAAKRVIDATGKLIAPSFMDTHMHIDKAFTMNDDNTVSLIAACNNSDKISLKYFDWTYDQIYSEIIDHSSQIIEMCIENGTTVIKTNVLFNKTWDTIALDAMLALKKKYKNYCDVLTCVSYPDEFRDELIARTAGGDVDFVAGYPHLEPDHKAVTDDCFTIAEKYGLPMDLHCDESDVVNLDCFNYIIDKTGEYGLQGRVTCGHVTGLDASGLPDEMAENAIIKAASVRMNVTSLTSCNMYLMNMTRRGPTRMRQLAEAGVNVAVASDNVRDTFRPFGNCDLLEEALLTAKVHKFGTTEWLRKTMGMVTYNAAANALTPDYGLRPGCRADFNIFDASLPETALLNQAKKLYVLKNGNIIAQNGEIVRDFM